MTQPAAPAAPAAPAEGVPAETILAKIAQSGDLGKLMVEKAYFQALAEQLANQLAQTQQTDTRADPGSAPSDPGADGS